MSQAAADALAPHVIAALEGEIPEARIYTNKRDSSDLPHAWLFAVDAVPDTTYWQMTGLVELHIWASSRGHLKDLMALVRPLQHVYAESEGTAHDIRFQRPTENVVDEETAVHGVLRFPVLYVDEAVVGKLGG